MKTLHLLTLVAFAACGGSHTETAAAVHHPSAASYEQAAAKQDQEAKEDDARFNPKAQGVEHCEARGFGCWGSEVNPTQTYLDQAKEHRKNAARLRALSQALRDAEARECAGLDAEDRDQSPFANVADIVSIEPATVSTKKGQRLEGTTFTFRPAKGMTLDWFQKVIRCHLARNDAMGHDVPSEPSCPLVPANVEATVKSVPNGFAVEVSSAEKSSIAEILRRTKMIQDQRAQLR